MPATREVNVYLRTLSGKRISARGEEVVIAAGGLETTRLLLASRSSHHPNGIGNENDFVGRYYSSHLAGNIGPFHWLGERRLPGLRYERDAGGIYVRRTLSLRSEQQESRRLLNFRATIAPPAISDPSHESAVLSAAYLSNRFILGKIPPEYDAEFGRKQSSEIRGEHIKNVIRHVPELALFAPWWIRRRVVPSRKIPSMEPRRGKNFFLHFDAEQTPLRDSRVMLGSDVDVVGMPRLSVHWKFIESDVDSLMTSYRLLAAELAEAGVAETKEADHSSRDRIISDLGVGSHHIGTTRMAARRTEGVVDSECRVFSVRNLSLASSSVFPTAGVANPTLTITAIALRVADRLKRMQ
jgi:choline dehydrogenase-like flavoprotein